VIAKLLELQRRVAGIRFEKLEILAGQLLNFFWERVETLPELRRRSMHLKLSQLAFSLGRFDFLPQKIELTRGGIPLDLSIPILPVSLGNPLPEPRKVFARQRFDFGLNGFDLGHRTLLTKAPQASATPSREKMKRYGYSIPSKSGQKAWPNTPGFPKISDG
jgi:hypothetical protein